MTCPVSVQIARDECISLISDLTKEIWGCRPRYDYASMSLETLAVMAEEVVDAHGHYFDEEFDASSAFDGFDAEAQAEADEWAAVCPDIFDELCEIRGW